MAEEEAIANYFPSLVFLNSALVTNQMVRTISKNYGNEIKTSGEYSKGETLKIKRRQGWANLESMIAYFGNDIQVLLSQDFQSWVVYFTSNVKVNDPAMHWNADCR